MRHEHECSTTPSHVQTQIVRHCWLGQKMPTMVWSWWPGNCFEQCTYCTIDKNISFNGILAEVMIIVWAWRQPSSLVGKRVINSRIALFNLLLLSSWQLLHVPYAKLHAANYLFSNATPILTWNLLCRYFTLFNGDFLQIIVNYIYWRLFAQCLKSLWRSCLVWMCP